MKGKLVAMILASVVGVPTVGTLAALGSHDSKSADADPAVGEQVSSEDALDLQDIVDSGADLLQACTVDGPALVAKEAADTISPIEQAALDALRPICGATANPLSEPPVPVQPTEVVTVIETASAAPTSSHETEHEEDHEKDHEEDHGSEHGDD